jgi:hypothetical protein
MFSGIIVALASTSHVYRPVRVLLSCWHQYRDTQGSDKWEFRQFYEIRRPWDDLEYVRQMSSNDRESDDLSHTTTIHTLKFTADTLPTCSSVPKVKFHFVQSTSPQPVNDHSSKQSTATQLHDTKPLPMAASHRRFEWSEGDLEEMKSYCKSPTCECVVESGDGVPEMEGPRMADVGMNNVNPAYHETASPISTSAILLTATGETIASLSSREINKTKVHLPFTHHYIFISFCSL